MLIGVRNDVLTATGGKQVPWDQHALRARLYLTAASVATLPVPSKAEIDAARKSIEAERAKAEAAAGEIAKRDVEVKRLTDELKRAEDERKKVASVAPPPAPAPKGSVATAKLILGMRLVPVADELRSRFNIQRTKGLVVTEVTPESASAKKGISVGDVIVEVAQETVETVDAFVQKIDTTRQAGRKVILVLIESPKGAVRFAAVSIEEATEIKPDPALSVVPGSGKSFRDRLKDGSECTFCPEMVVVPAGSFTMGSPESEVSRDDDEGPLRSVTIGKSLAVGRFAVTREEFAVFVRATGHRSAGGCYAWLGSKWDHQMDKSWLSPGFKQDDLHPVACVNWGDATAFASWLSTTTGKSYRLLSEAEREYVTRAGTTTRYAFGNEIAEAQANYGNRIGGTTRAGTYPANAWGVHDMHGNVWEWVEDCYRDTYVGAPVDGSAAASTICSQRALRGGSWFITSQYLRSADRSWNLPDVRSNRLGFRVARNITP